MSSKKELLVQTTGQLLEKQGYHATALSEILEESGTPKGSLYHYFPGGKEQIAAEAIEHTGKTLAEHIRSELSRHTNPAIAVRELLLAIAERVESSDYCSGGPLTAVAIETVNASEPLNRACREAYQQMQESFSSRFVQAGIEPAKASRMAEFTLAAIEGASILSRTQKSGDPLRRVSDELYRYLAGEIS